MSDFYHLSPDQQEQRMRELGARALAQWNLEGADLALLKMRENAVFRVRSDDGRRYALRIHRHGYHSDDALASELKWMQALDAAGRRAVQKSDDSLRQLRLGLVELSGAPRIESREQVLQRVMCLFVELANLLGQLRVVLVREGHERIDECHAASILHMP